MPLTMYRRHNTKKCSSTDSQHCSSKKRPCPIWVRGALANGTYIREPLKTRDWTKAQDIARELEVTGERPAPTAPQEKTTIEEWRDSFLRNAQTENLSEETLRKYKLLFKQLMEFARDRGIRFVGELELATLQDFRGTWSDAPLSKSTKQQRLRSLFRFAVAHKWIAENPALQLGRIKVGPTQQIPFTQDEMGRILEAAKQAGPEIYTFVLVMRFSGLRISDACMLRTSSLEGRHLTLRTEKTGAPVKVQLPEVVADGLRAIPKESPQYFFWNGRSKLSSVTDLWRTRRIRPVFKKAGVKDAHTHRFRHTFAVELLRQGTPAGIVATLLGNTERVVVKYYSGWVESRQKGLDEAVEKANGYHRIEPVRIV